MLRSEINAQTQDKALQGTNFKEICWTDRFSVNRDVHVTRPSSKACRSDTMEIPIEDLGSQVRLTATIASLHYHIIVSSFYLHSNVP